MGRRWGSVDGRNGMGRSCRTWRMDIMKTGDIVNISSHLTLQTRWIAIIKGFLQVHIFFVEWYHTWTVPNTFALLHVVWRCDVPPFLLSIALWIHWIEAMNPAKNWVSQLSGYTSVFLSTGLGSSRKGKVASTDLIRDRWGTRERTSSTFLQSKDSWRVQIPCPDHDLALKSYVLQLSAI